MAIFNSYVSLPEGKYAKTPWIPMDSGDCKS